MRCMKLLFLVTCFLGIQPAFGQISLDKQQYQPGDTVVISTDLPALRSDSVHFATLYLFIEDVQKTKRWEYRYPIVDGIGSATLVIDSTMPKGKYVFNFLLRKKFFSIQGTITGMKTDGISYTMRTKEGETYINKVGVDEYGDFSLRAILFEDTCSFYFRKTNTSIKGDPVVFLRTVLDSVFVPDTSMLHMVQIGQANETDEKLAALYKPEMGKLLSGLTLPGVQVSAVSKRKVDLFNEEYSNGAFRNSETKIFDGLEDRKIAESISVIDFLRGRVAGLSVMPGRNGYILRWQGQSTFNRNVSNVDVFVDEMLMTTVNDNLVNPADVAMIKIFPPPAFLRAGGQAGAIAIYTKKGEEDIVAKARNTFRVFGYSPMEADWKF
jgi:hypothetical protein